MGACQIHFAPSNPLFEGWADEQRVIHPNVSAADWAAFKQRMFGGEFVYNVSRNFIRSCPTPMLVLMGTDAFHPELTSREIVSLAPNATLVERWKEPGELQSTCTRVIEFLASHS